MNNRMKRTYNVTHFRNGPVLWLYVFSFFLGLQQPIISWSQTVSPMPAQQLAVPTWHLEWTLQPGTAAIQALASGALHPHTGAAADAAGAIWWWTCEMGPPRVVRLPGHDTGAVAVSFSADGHYLAAISATGQFSLWQPGTQTRLAHWQISQPARTSERNETGVAATTTSADHEVAAALLWPNAAAILLGRSERRQVTGRLGGKRNQIHYWVEWRNTRDGTAQMLLQTMGQVTILSLAPDQSGIVVGDVTGRVYWYSFVEKKLGQVVQMGDRIDGLAWARQQPANCWLTTIDARYQPFAIVQTPTLHAELWHYEPQRQNSRRIATDLPRTVAIGLPNPVVVDHEGNQYTVANQNAAVNSTDGMQNGDLVALNRQGKWCGVGRWPNQNRMNAVKTLALAEERPVLLSGHWDGSIRCWHVTRTTE